MVDGELDRGQQAMNGEKRTVVSVYAKKCILHRDVLYSGIGGIAVEKAAIKAGSNVRGSA